MSERVNRQELIRGYERRIQLRVPAEVETLRLLPLFAGVPPDALVSKP